jgi:hydroxymethylglutaryl-CoA lyase
MRRVLCSSARRFGVRGLPRRTRVHEVAPRDGLQNETTVLSTPAKLSLIRQLVASGPSSVEVTSFVRADVIPALADADEVCAQLWQQEWAHDARSDGMEFVGLVLNKHGFDRFLRAQLDAVTLVVSCTDTHSKANSGKGFDDALVAMFDLVRMAHAEGVKVRTYASMAFGCPFEGDVEEARVRAVVTAMAEAGADTVVLADTIGTGHPEQARALAELALEIVPAERLGMHMHDTYGRAVDNCAVGVQLGLVHMDSAVGGCGGCPFAPGAAGNLATHDLLAMLDDAGVAHGVDSARLVDAHATLEAALGREMKPHHVGRHG